MANQQKDARITQAVLKAFDVGVDEAAIIFDMDPRDLLGYQKQFIDRKSAELNPKTDLPDEETPPTIWEKIRKNPFFDISFKISLTLLFILICWRIPFVLQSEVDPLTNTVIWMGFTAAYLTAFGGLVLDLVFYTQHHANFEFLNPFTRPGGEDDYQTILLSGSLTPYEKCRLNQGKYLAYLFAYVLILLALANLTQGG